MSPTPRSLLSTARCTPPTGGSCRATPTSGAIALRHDLDDFLGEVGGHVGFGIRPSARRPGLARWALGAVHPRAHSLGLDRVLATCDDGNVASARTIEANGGRLEDVRETDSGPKRRYWIEL